MKRGREAYEVTSSRSRRVALLNLVINGLESVIGEYGCREVRAVLPESVGGTLTVCYSSCEEIPEEGFELDSAIDYGLLSDYAFEPCGRGLSLEDLYTVAQDLAAKEAMSTLSAYALKCALTEVEYMLLILQNGKAAILEGERDKVVIPAKGVSFTAHTHPRGCVPSPHDIKSLINLLFEGGLGSAVISTECGLMLFRNGPFTEEDLLALTNFRSIVGGRDPRRIVEVLSKGRVGPNIIVKRIS